MVNAFINPQIFTVVGIIAVIVTAAVITIIRRRIRPKKFTWKVEAFLGVIVLASGWLASSVTFNIQQGIMNGARTASIAEVYGLDLTQQNLADLRIPRGAPPTPEEGEYTPFGVTQVVQDGKVLTIFASWDGKSFELRDEDGTPLPRLSD